MKSNLKLKDYKHLIKTSTIIIPSKMDIILEKFRGTIECHKIKIGSGYQGRNINGIVINSIIKYGFKIKLHFDKNEINSYYLNQIYRKVKIDSIDYYAGDYKIDYKNNLFEIAFISYKLFDKDEF